MKVTKDTRFVLLSTACVFLACSVVVLGYFIRNPIRAQWYIWKLRRNVGNRSAAIYELGKIRNSRAAVWAVVETLDGRYGKRESIGAMDVLTDESDWSTNSDKQAILSVMTEVLRNGNDDRLRSACATLLAWSCGKPAIPVLIEMLDDRGDGVRAGAAEGLGFLQEQSVLPTLIGMLHEDHATVRASAARSLGAMKDESTAAVVMRILATLLKDENADVRKGSAYALYRLLAVCPDRSALPALKEAMNDPEDRVRSYSIRAIGRTGGKSEIPLLSRVLFTDKNLDDRADAADALGEIDDHSAVPLLVKALGDDPSEGVRTVAARALGAIGDSSAIACLIKSLSDESPYVREECHQALQTITGEGFAFGDDVAKKWRERLEVKEAMQEDETQTQN